MTGRTSLRTLSSIAFVAASVATATPARAQQAGIDVGAMVPDPVVETLDGERVRLSQIVAGRAALIEFWATWCPLCRELEPAMKAAHARHGRDVAFVSVGVPHNQTPERQKAHVERRMLVGTFVFDRNEEASRAFKVPHTSYVVVIDASGHVVYTGVGGDQDIEAALARLREGMDEDRD